MQRTLNPEERAREIGFIKNVPTWPMFPMLPLKNSRESKPGDFPRFGTIFKGDLTPYFEGKVEILDASIDKLLGDPDLVRTAKRDSTPWKRLLTRAGS